MCFPCIEEVIYFAIVLDERRSKNMDQKVYLLDLPNETLMYIFEFFSYEEVAKFRIVCKRIDEICQKILNTGFQRAAQLHAATYKQIKALLPRRESERRNHALARHADILTSVETRISMLSMTYTKYMDLNMCCFIPGRVLDEIFWILKITSRTFVPLRPLEILQEFRDISSMAIEHFDEKIASEFKKTIEKNLIAKVNSIGSGSSTCVHRRSFNATGNLPSIVIGERESGELLLVRKYVTTNMLKRTSMQSIENANAKEKDGDVHIQNKCNLRSRRKATVRNLHHQVKMLQGKGVQQKKHLAFYARKVNCLTSQMAALKRRLDELDSKNQELIGTIRQYSSEDTQTEASIATVSPDNKTSEELSEDKKPQLETMEETGSQKSSAESKIYDNQTHAIDGPACDLKLLRKSLKRQIDAGILNEAAEKKAKF